jgi:HEAT repeat protein
MLAVFMAGGTLLGSCTFLAAAGDPEVTEKAVPAKCEIKPLIDQLGSERFKDREQAAHELAKLGNSALPALKEAAKSRDLEVRRRAQQLVEQLKPPVRATDSQRQPSIPALKIYL